MAVGVFVGDGAGVFVGRGMDITGVGDLGVTVGASVAVGLSLSHAMSTAEIRRTAMRNGNVVLIREI